MQILNKRVEYYWICSFAHNLRCRVVLQGAVLAAVSSAKWNSFYNNIQPLPLSSDVTDAMVDFNDDEVTSAGNGLTF